MRRFAREMRKDMVAAMIRMKIVEPGGVVGGKDMVHVHSPNILLKAGYISAALSRTKIS